jgi:hypothetical protein
MSEYITTDELRGGNNIMLTQALFVEFGNKDAPYTMKHESYKSHKSIYEIYMESTDEYEAALKIVKNMVHWEKLCELKWFMEGLPEKNIRGLRHWRDDMKRRDASLAKKQLMDEAKVGNVSAMRLLYETSNKTTAGRPKKKPVQKTNEGSAVSLFKGLNNAR